MNSKGFTLIEMLVVVSVIIILTLIIVPIYQGSRNQLALQRAANKLAQDIRKAEQMAMAAKEIKGNVPPRYGLEFNAGSTGFYILFADNGSGADYNNGKREPSDEIIETINFEKGVIIKQLLADGNSESKIWITFSPPDPTTKIRTPAASGILICRIQITGGGQTKAIIVNNAGLIYIE